MKHLIIRSFIEWVLLVGLLSNCLVAEDYRTIQRSTIVANHGEKYKVKDFGNYYALLIYVEDYLNLKDLKTPKKDVEAISRILKNRYGFIETKIVKNPKNSDALIKVLDEFKNRLKEHDNLLIYYAGHGSKNGYWQLSSAEQKSRVGWISIKEAINQTLQEMHSKHVLVVADSCYSGYLLRNGVSLNNLNTNDKKYYSKLYEIKSRNVLTSGGLQPVLDRDPTNPNHSVFANGFLMMLKKNSRAIFSLEEQYPKVKRYVQLNSESQIPLYGDVKLSGHEDGGDFIFLDRKMMQIDKKKVVTVNKKSRKDVPLNIKISSNVVYITPSHGIPLKDGNSSVFNLTNTILPKIKNKKLIINKKNREFSFDICGDTTYLLTIGINDYGGYESPLRYAELDALRFKIKIENSCGMVKSVTLLGKEATRNNIVTNLEKMSTTKDDVVLVYFTGHAITVDNQAYLIPYIRRTLNNKKVVVNEAMNLNLLSDVLNSKQGKESLVVIDSQINDVWK